MVTSSVTGLQLGVLILGSVKVATIRFPRGGGGQEYLSRANYLFQPGSAAR